METKVGGNKARSPFPLGYRAIPEKTQTGRGGGGEGGWGGGVEDILFVHCSEFLGFLIYIPLEIPDRTKLHP